MNKFAVSVIVVVAALLIAGFFGGYFIFFKDKNEQLISGQEANAQSFPAIINEPIMHLSAPVLPNSIVRAFPGVVRDSENTTVPAFFYDVPEGSQLIASFPGVVQIKNHFLNAEKLMITDKDYDIFILLSGAQIQAEHGSYAGLAESLGTTGTKLPENNANVAMYVRNNKNGNYIDIREFPNMKVVG